MMYFPQFELSFTAEAQRTLRRRRAAFRPPVRSPSALLRLCGERAFGVYPGLIQSRLHNLEIRT